jgi:hypothetical protein
MGPERRKNWAWKTRAWMTGPECRTPTKSTRNWLLWDFVNGGIIIPFGIFSLAHWIILGDRFLSNGPYFIILTVKYNSRFAFTNRVTADVNKQRKQTGSRRWRWSLHYSRVSYHWLPRESWRQIPLVLLIASLLHHVSIHPHSLVLILNQANFLCIRLIVHHLVHI